MEDHAGHEMRDAGKSRMRRRGIIAGVAAFAVAVAAERAPTPVAAATVTLGAFNTEGDTTTFYLPGPSANAAVLGTADTGIGVQGTAYNVYGVYGYIPAASGASNTIGVYGVNNATGGNNHGVEGNSTNGYGVLGYTSAGPAAVYGFSTGVNTPAFGAINYVAGGLAGTFGGKVYVNGQFVVANPALKSGAIPHPDGSHRLVYCVEAAESWVEDFGKAKLINGQATVKLDPDFAALIHADDYHVFLTPYGEGESGLDVTEQHMDGFAVKEQRKGTSGRTFSWRVVARPQGQLQENAQGQGRFARLEKFDLPKDLPRPVIPLAPLSGVPPKP